MLSVIATFVATTSCTPAQYDPPNVAPVIEPEKTEQDEILAEFEALEAEMESESTPAPEEKAEEEPGKGTEPAPEGASEPGKSRGSETEEPE
jgi:hypothetical protein